MKYEVLGNDCLPSIDVTRDGEELLVRFWGFTYEEADHWFNSKMVMDSLNIWNSVIGDFEMTVKINNI